MKAEEFVNALGEYKVTEKAEEFLDIFLLGEYEMSTKDKVEKIGIYSQRSAVFRWIKLLESKGWKNENINYLDGSILLRLSGKDYGRKAEIKGLLRPMKTRRKEIIFLSSNPSSNWVYDKFCKSMNNEIIKKWK